MKFLTLHALNIFYRTTKARSCLVAVSVTFESTQSAFYRLSAVYRENKQLSWSDPQLKFTINSLLVQIVWLDLRCVNLTIKIT